jgi:putative hemolysin
MSILVTFSILALLIAFNALYVAAEFSTVSSRRSRLSQMADEENKLARYMLSVVEDPHNLDTYVAACQIGITISSLVVGYYGQARLLAFAQPWIDQLEPATRILVQSISAIVILFFLTILQVVLGELVPKNVGLQYPEKLATLTARPMQWSVAIFRPLIWVFNGSGRLILRMMGSEPVAEHAHIHSPEEIVMLVEESSAGGRLDAEERRLLVNTLQLRELTARMVMIPRNRMLIGETSQSCGDLFTLLAESPYSRLPLYEETVDNIVGVVHLKDLINAHYRSKTQYRAGEPEVTEVDAPSTDIRALMRPALHVPDSLEIGEVMSIMQQAHHNLVIVVDEFGGTAGMITFEDLIEEIIGEFEDEFDAENPPICVQDERIHVRGDVLVSDLNETFELLLPTDDVNTIGGLVLKDVGATPGAGDVVVLNAGESEIAFNVESIYQHGIASVSFAATPEQIDRVDLLLQADD